MMGVRVSLLFILSFNICLNAYALPRLTVSTRVENQSPHLAFTDIYNVCAKSILSKLNELRNKLSPKVWGDLDWTKPKTVTARIMYFGDSFGVSCSTGLPSVGVGLFQDPPIWVPAMVPEAVLKEVQYLTIRKQVGAEGIRRRDRPNDYQKLCYSLAIPDEVTIDQKTYQRSQDLMKPDGTIDLGKPMEYFTYFELSQGQTAPSKVFCEVSAFRQKDDPLRGAFFVSNDRYSVPQTQRRKP